MHGVIHNTLEEYVVSKTDDETWKAVLDSAGVEPRLYLLVSHYDDAEIEAILATVAEMAVQDRRAIERDFGRLLAPKLLETFDAYVDSDWRFEDLLASIETIYDEIENASAEIAPPKLAASEVPAANAVDVTYRTHREHTYCAMAHGILEGLASAFEADATVTKTTCVDDGADACRFRVTFD